MNQDEKRPDDNPRGSRSLNLPEGPDDTAEPDGQFPDNDPAVGTIKAPPAEDPVPVREPKREDGRPGEDQNTHGDSGGTS